MTSFEQSFSDFKDGVHGLINGTANAKGYASNGGDGRALIDFVAETCGEGHALGEIIYKVTRWRRKRNPEDLLKAAAWCFLEWDRHERRIETHAPAHSLSSDGRLTVGCCGVTAAHEGF